MFIDLYGRLERDGPAVSENWGRCERRTSVFQRSNIVPIAPAGAFRPVAVSRKSIEGFADLCLKPLQRAVLQFGDDEPRVMSVEKVDGYHLTARFEDAWADLPHSLAKLGRSRRQKNGEPRPADDILARLSIAGTGQMVIVRDISHAGALIEPHLPLIPGQSILFFLNIGMPLLAEVRWTKRGRAGLKFARYDDPARSR